MPDIAVLTSEGKLSLPANIAEQFRPSDRFLVWTEGDTLHLKRLAPHRLTDLVADNPDEAPLSSEEIAEEVRVYRRNKHSG